ncbi:MAG: response regulator [Desulfurivibrionaceae bacterium]
MDAPHVLLVENNPDNVSLICKMLGQSCFDDFKVELASTLAQSIEMMNATTFDAVLLEMVLSDSAGLNTVRQITKRFPEAAIIVLNELSSNSLASQAIRYGAQDFLEIKFLSAKRLVQTINYAIERKRNMSQKERLLADLTGALEEIEMLRKIIPVCAGCNKIHDANNRWRSLESYLQEFSVQTAKIAICPECEDTLYSGARHKRGEMRR